DRDRPPIIEPQETPAVTTGRNRDRQEAANDDLVGSIDPVRAYLRLIARTALLSAAEEIELAQRIEVGVFAAERLSRPDEDLPATTATTRELRWLARDGVRAKAHLVEANLRLVASVAKRYGGARHALPRPRPGRHHRPHPRGREVRSHHGLQVLHLRHLVDPPGDQPLP